MGDSYGGRGMGGRGFRGGFKRRREEEQPMDPIRIMLSNLIRFGDEAVPVRDILIINSITILIGS